MGLSIDPCSSCLWGSQVLALVPRMYRTPSIDSCHGLVYTHQPGIVPGSLRVSSRKCQFITFNADFYIRYLWYQLPYVLLFSYWHSQWYLAPFDYPATMMVLHNLSLVPYFDNYSLQSNIWTFCIFTRLIFVIINLSLTIISVLAIC